MKLLLLLLSVCLCLSSQNTKVIPLEASDATMVKRAYDDLETAKKRWEQVDEFVQKKYGGTGRLEYSDDFRYTIKPARSGCSGNICWGSIASDEITIVPDLGTNYGSAPPVRR